MQSWLMADRDTKLNRGKLDHACVHVIFHNTDFKLNQLFTSLGTQMYICDIQPIDYVQFHHMQPHLILLLNSKLHFDNPC